MAQNALARWNEWRRQPVFLYGVHHAAFFMTIFVALGHLFYYGPGELERFTATQILDGKLPYRDFPSEYPPVAFIGFLLPALLFRNQPGYSFAFAFELLIADILIMAAVAALARRLKLSSWNTLFLYTLSIAAVGPLVITRYDLLPAVLTIAGVYAFVTNRSHAAWALIALGTGAKLYPVMVVPILALYHLRQKQYGRLIGGALVFLLVAVALVSPWLFSKPESLTTLLTYHAQRGLHSESTYGTVLLVMQAFKAISLQASLTFGSWNLIHPVADRLAGYSTYVLVAALLAVYVLFAWRLSKTGSKAGSLDFRTTQLLVVFSLLAVTVFVLTNKVFSPQYLVWLCPFVPLVTGRWRTPVAVLFVVAAAVTQYIFPYHYIEFEMFKPYLVFMAFGRNLMLGALLVLLAMSWGPVKKADARRGR